MMYCPRCHASVTPDANFCQNCGLNQHIAFDEAPTEVETLTLPAPTTGATGVTIEELLGVTDEHEQRLNMFVFDIAPFRLVEAMQLPTYHFKGLDVPFKSQLCVLDDPYRYLISPGTSYRGAGSEMRQYDDPEKTYLYALIATGHLNDLDARDYFRLERRLRQILPEELHERLDLYRKNRGW